MPETPAKKPFRDRGYSYHKYQLKRSTIGPEKIEVHFAFSAAQGRILRTKIRLSTLCQSDGSERFQLARTANSQSLPASLLSTDLFQLLRCDALFSWPSRRFLGNFESSKSIAEHLSILQKIRKLSGVYTSEVGSAVLIANLGELAFAFCIQRNASSAQEPPSTIADRLQTVCS